MAALREWLTAVMAVSLLLSVARMLVPVGPLRDVAALIGGLILLTVLLRPVLDLDMEDIHLNAERFTETVEQRQAELEAVADQALTERIESETAAYISDKAGSLGLTLRVRVTAEDRDGVPVPVRVELTGPRSEVLSRWMETELGLPAEGQVWNEG